MISVGSFAGIADSTIRKSKDDLVANLQSLEPTLQGLADAGPALTQSMAYLPAFPWGVDGAQRFVHGDYANLSATIDLTLGRLDNSLLQTTPYNGVLTALETAMGRSVGRMPTEQTTTNPLTAPVQRDDTGGGR